MEEAILCVFVSHAGNLKSMKGIIMIKERLGQLEHTVIADGMIG